MIGQPVEVLRLEGNIYCDKIVCGPGCVGLVLNNDGSVSLVSDRLVFDERLTDGERRHFANGQFDGPID